FLESTLAAVREGGARFVGELMLAHADKKHGERTGAGERYVAPDGKNLLRLLAALEEKPVPVMTHWEVYDWERDWPGMRALYARFPKLTFVWPHAGFGSPEQVETVLSASPNVVITLSKKEMEQASLSDEEKSDALGGPVVDDCGRLHPEWKALI